MIFAIFTIKMDGRGLIFVTRLYDAIKKNSIRNNCDFSALANLSIVIIIVNDFQKFYSDIKDLINIQWKLFNLT